MAPGSWHQRFTVLFALLSTFITCGLCIGSTFATVDSPSNPSPPAPGPFQMEGANGATPGAPPTGASFRSFRTVLRTAVLTCIGKGLRGPFLEKSGAVGEEIRLNPGSPAGHHRMGGAADSISQVGGEGNPSLGKGVPEPAGRLVATKTVLLVKGKGDGIHRVRLKFVPIRCHQHTGQS